MFVKVECFINQGEYLPPSYYDNGYLPQTRFGVVIGQVYTVYGICIYRDILQYLISRESDNSLLPDWYPAVLFKIVDAHLPTDWYFSEYLQKSEYQMQAICGYRELVLDENHNDELLEREVEAIRIFLTAKRKIDEKLQLWNESA